MNRTRFQLVATCSVVGCFSVLSPSLAGDTGQAILRHDHVTTMSADGASCPDDHAPALAQLDGPNSSHVAARSGNWSDPDTWSSGVPTSGARVWHTTRSPITTFTASSKTARSGGCDRPVLRSRTA